MQSLLITAAFVTFTMGASLFGQDIPSPSHRSIASLLATARAATITPSSPRAVSDALERAHIQERLRKIESIKSWIIAQRRVFAGVLEKEWRTACTIEKVLNARLGGESSSFRDKATSDLSFYSTASLAIIDKQLEALENAAMSPITA